MTTSRIHLEAASSFHQGINKNGIETFYNYIESELNKQQIGNICINCYDNPLQITLCVYFALLSNHRFYKSYNNNNNNNGINTSNINNNATSSSSSFMSDGSDITMKDKIGVPPPPIMYKSKKIDPIPPFPIDILYQLPVSGCIGYLQLQGLNCDENENPKGKDHIDKSIEKCIYLIRHHYPHLLFWLDVTKLLISPKFAFLQYGLNLDLMGDQLYFNKYGIKGNLLKIHKSFIKDFNKNQKEWIKTVSFKIAPIFMSLITDKDVEPDPKIQLLPNDISLENINNILYAMSCSFQNTDLIHHKWQYIFCYWWHKYSMYQPLTFICSSLRPFINNSTDFQIKYVLNLFTFIYTFNDDNFFEIGLRSDILF